MLRSIEEIQNLKFREAKKMAIEHMVIKGHDVFFIDFEGYFGYSYCVFKNNHHIYYANDYELHHSKKEREELRRIYINKCNNTLFKDNEFVEPLKTYDEYKRKLDYLINYYTQQINSISMFTIFHNDEEKKAFNRKISRRIVDKVGHVYVVNNDTGKAFVKKHYELFFVLKKRFRETNMNYDFLKSAYIYEMYNFEYVINSQGDLDVLSCFGNVNGVHDYLDINELFKACEFNDVQKKAYMDARKEVMSNRT